MFGLQEKTENVYCLMLAARGDIMMDHYARASFDGKKNRTPSKREVVGSQDAVAIGYMLGLLVKRADEQGLFAPTQSQADEFMGYLLGEDIERMGLYVRGTGDDSSTKVHARLFVAVDKLDELKDDFVGTMVELECGAHSSSMYDKVMSQMPKRILSDCGYAQPLEFHATG